LADLLEQGGDGIGCGRVQSADGNCQLMKQLSGQHGSPGILVQEDDLGLVEHNFRNG
jgi:hypothetical protein